MAEASKETTTVTKETTAVKPQSAADRKDAAQTEPLAPRRDSNDPGRDRQAEIREFRDEQEARKAQERMEKYDHTTKKPGTVQVRLLRDFWGYDGVRHAKGKYIYVALEDAKVLIKGSKAQRVDPLMADSAD